MGDAWFFDWFAPIYDRVMPPADRDTLEAGLKRGTVDIESVVDLAGGSGRIARELDDAYDVVVVDRSRSMLTEARRHAIEAVQGDGARLPIPDGTVDAVVIADAYHHLVRPDVVCSEVHRVLKPGGVLVVRDFDPATVRGRGIELVEGLFGFPCEFRTPPALAADLEAAGFDARVLDEGFGYTVAGVVPESDS